MAKTLESFDFDTRSPRSQYEQYLDGQIWKIDRAEDTQTQTIEGLRSAIIAAARRKGLWLHTQKEGTTHLIVQAYKKD